MLYYAAGPGPDGESVSENRVQDILLEGRVGKALRLPLEKLFTSYFTTTVRGGSPASNTLELLGQRAGAAYKTSYARVR